MASFVSVLSDIGKGLKKFFTVALDLAVAAEPFVNSVFPGVGLLFNAVVTEVGVIEGAAAAAGAQTGTGPQKLAAVTAAVEGAFAQYEAANNIKTPHTAAQIEAAVNGAVAFLNALHPAA